MRSSLASYQREIAPAVDERSEAFFFAQLSDVCAEVQDLDGKDWKIICPFHVDSSPSCAVNKAGGYYHCWSCSAHGPWNRLAEKLGMERQVVEALSDDNVSMLLKRAGIKLSRRARKIRRDDDEAAKQSRPLVRPWDPQESFRGLSAEFMAFFGCKQVLDLRHACRRAGLPVRDTSGLLRGYTCRAIEPANAKPKYSPISADHEWFREKELDTTGLLFGLDTVRSDRVVLVEGPIDAMLFQQAGIPAVALLGVDGWNDAKAALLAGAGVRFVLVLMDRDRAGQEAVSRIVGTLTGRMQRTLVLNLPACKEDPAKKVDPGDLTPKQREWVGARLFAMT